MNIILLLFLILPLISCNSADPIPQPLESGKIHLTLVPESEFAQLSTKLKSTGSNNCVRNDTVPGNNIEISTYFICGVPADTFPQNLFKEYENVVELMITNLPSLKTWKKEDFTGANRLQHIKIVDTVLDIPASFFANVPELKEFSVKNSKINEIDSSAFSAASKLEMIEFANDSLSTLPAGLFDGLTNLKKVFLIFNNFENIEAINFPEKNGIQYVDLAQNKINQITDKSFDKLANLKFLILAGNQIEQIPANAFIKLSKLMLLDISHNKIEKITKPMLEGIGGFLRFLRVGSNKINHIDADAFSGFKFLEKLILNENKLETLDSNTFAGLYNLEILELSQNQIEEMNPTLFKDLVNLERIEMRHGKLKSFDLNILEYTPNLKYIEIVNNDITEITKYVPKTSPLRASNNDKNPPLTQQEQEFYDEFIKRLKEHRLYSFHPKFWDELDVPESELVGDNKLLSIDMRDNKVSELDKHFFKHLKNIRKFIMSRNPIELDYDTLVEATKLEYLMLIENDLTSFDFEKISHLPNLKYLYIGGNEIKTVDIPAETRFESLEELDLGFNRVRFRTFSIKKESFPKLKKLEIAGLLTDCVFVKRLRESKQFENVDVDAFNANIDKNC